MSNINPYALGTVKSRNDFYGFKKQLKLVESLIEQSVEGESKNICFIGEPSTGKTSFLNICEEYCEEKEIHTCRANVGVGCLPYEFFNDLFIELLNSLIRDYQSKSFGNMKRDYMEISNTGASSSDEYDLDFALSYYDWKNRKKPKDDLPELSTIVNDFCTIYDSHETELLKIRPNSRHRIAIFIDDFQKIVGIDEKGRIKDEANLEHSCRNADSICEILRTLIERHSDKFIFFVATYPGLVRKPFELPRKLVQRCFETIDVNQFNNEEETKELILGCLDKLNVEHPWYRLFKKEDVSLLREGWEVRFGKFGWHKDQQKSYLKKNIEALAGRVHSDSQGRPFAIKLEMFQVFDSFEEPDKNNWPLIRYDALDKWQNIYKAVSNKFKDNPFYDIIEGYSLETKFHLYLFLNNRRLDIEEIIEYIEFCVVCHNIKLFNERGYSLEKISDKEITNESFIFDGELIDLKHTNYDKLKNSLERFIHDNILEYDNSQTVHYRNKLPILESNYVRYHLDSLGFPNIRSHHEFLVSKVKEFDKTVLIERAFDFREFIKLTPGISADEEIEHLKVFFENPSTIDSFPTGAIPEDLLSAILGQIMSSSSMSIHLMRLVLDKDDFHNERLSFIANYSLGLSDDGIPIYFPIDLDEVDLLKKSIYERLVSFEEKNTGFVFKYTDNGPFELDFRQKLQLAISLEKKGKFDELVRTFKKDNYQNLWEIGEIDLAIDSVDIRISDLEVEYDNIEEIYNDISNHTYLSLCQNDKKRARACLNKYKDYITKPTVEKPLPMYNFTMLRVFLGKIVHQNLVKLMNKFLDNDELLRESKSRDILTCLVLFGDGEASLVEVPGFSTFESLFISIKTLIDNGEKINLTKSLSERMHKEFELLEKDNKDYCKKLDKHLPGIEKLVKMEA